jgi:flagellar biogenesis protein FliO
MMWTKGHAATYGRLGACAHRLSGLALLCAGMGLASPPGTCADDLSALPLALTPAGQGPISVEPRQGPPALSRKAQAVPPMEATAGPPGSDNAGVGRGDRPWRPPLDVRLVPASSGASGASTRHSPRPLTPRRAPSRSGSPAVGSISAARPASLVVGSLAAVVGLLALIVWCTRRFAPPGMSVLPKEVLEPLGRAVLPGQQAVQLVRLGPKLLLIAQHEGSLATLAEITDPAEVEHLLALCRRQRPDSATTAFAQVLAQWGEAEGATEHRSPRMLARGGR